MKSKWKWIYNPFERLAGLPALIIGIVAMALTAVIGKINHVAFDGVIDVHTGALFGFSASFAMQAVAFLALFLTMWIAGICFSKSRLRVIDIAGTTALARAPMLLLAVICFLPVAPAGIYDISRIIIFGIICFPFLVWMIALMYNAYTVSCNLKGGKAVISFIGALLVAEIISKLVFIFLLSGLFTNNSPVASATLEITNSAKNVTFIADSLTIRQKTEKVVHAFEQGDFDSITIYFDENMEKNLSTEKLKLAWTQVILTCGKFEKAGIDSLKETHIDKYDVIEVPLFFQNNRLNLRLAFNSDGKIGGLFFLPVNQ